MRSRNLFQIFIAADGTSSEPSEELALNAASLRQQHPGYSYRRLNEADLDAFIAAQFDTDTLAAFRGLKPYAYKADLARYCLLLVHGGIYADVAMRVLRPLVLPEGKAMLCFRDTPGTGLWTVSNGLIASEAGRGELKLAVDLIKANVEARRYGASALHPTGPALFGRALAITDRIEEIEIGSFGHLGSDRSPHNLGYLDGAGRIVALRWKSGRFGTLGLAGTNDYAQMWTSRIVYGETTRRYGLDRLRCSERSQDNPAGIRRTADGIAIDRQSSGRLVHGPSMPLPAGRYLGSFLLAPGSDLAGVRIDAHVRLGEIGKVVASRTLTWEDGAQACLEFPVERDTDAFQLRLFGKGGAHGTILGLEIEPSPSSF